MTRVSRLLLAPLRPAPPRGWTPPFVLPLLTLVPQLSQRPFPRRSIGRPETCLLNPAGRRLPRIRIRESAPADQFPRSVEPREKGSSAGDVALDLLAKFTGAAEFLFGTEAMPESNFHGGFCGVPRIIEEVGLDGEVCSVKGGTHANVWRRTIKFVFNHCFRRVHAKRGQDLLARAEIQSREENFVFFFKQKTAYEIEGGRYFVRGSPDRVKTFGDIALTAYLAHDLPDG